VKWDLEKVTGVVSRLRLQHPCFYSKQEQRSVLSPKVRIDPGTHTVSYSMSTTESPEATWPEREADR